MASDSAFDEVALRKQRGNGSLRTQEAELLCGEEMHPLPVIHTTTASISKEQQIVHCPLSHSNQKVHSEPRKVLFLGVTETYRMDSK